MKTNKTAPCKTCCPDGGAYFRRDLDLVDGEWIDYWECQNCLARTPIRKRRKGSDFKTANNRQKATAAALVAEWEEDGRYVVRTDEKIVAGSLNLFAKIYRNATDEFPLYYRNVYIGRQGAIKSHGASGKKLTGWRAKYPDLY